MTGQRLQVAFGADDGNECVDAVRRVLTELAEVHETPAGAPWPHMAQAVAGRVASGDADYAVIMCWTGTGTAIAANKVPGVRAALAWEPWIARNARLWNDANVLTLSLKRTAPDVAADCVRAFLEIAEPDPREAADIERLRKLDR